MNTRNTLKKEDVLHIKSRLIAGVEPKILASVFMVNVQTIYDIKNKRTWNT
ncbi:unnamed protein product [marine sediment metagenome]|uniref:Uncharacterized protein n=1 Tax=marine sediment metagenome TaxID=412755 RepID=X0T9Q0_9ZZZZ